MNHETELLVQAYADGELGYSKRRKAEALLRNNAEARELLEALRATKAFLAGNEPEFRVPSSREFYWSGIERRILTEKSAPADPAESPFDWRSRWVRLTASLAMAGLAIGLVLSSSIQNQPTRIADHLGEIETPSEEVSGVSFHSYSDGMTLVWVQTRAN